MLNRPEFAGNDGESYLVQHPYKKYMAAVKRKE